MGALSNNAIAFYTGLFGSIHCIGMCGPLAFAIPMQAGSKWLLLWDKLIYQIGRICSYIILGLIIGSLGKQIWLLGIQRSISIISGVIIILAASVHRVKPLLSGLNYYSKLSGVISKWIGFALKHKWGHFSVGMLNGLLPCGFVYIALLGAINTQGAMASVQYMASFGLGTLPLMFMAATGSAFISTTFRRRLNKIVPYFMLCLGCWFILRGMGLNVPYLSPMINAASATCG